MNGIRNIIVLLLCIAAGMSSADIDRASRISSGKMPTSLSIDRTPADRWQCERICNSDLNLCSAGSSIPGPQLVPCVRPGGTHAPAHAATTVWRVRLRQRLREAAATAPVAGTRTADYYVYRLRRLII